MSMFDDLRAAISDPHEFARLIAVAVDQINAAAASNLSGDAVYISGVITGTGSSQNTAHGLGVTPTKVFISVVDNNAGDFVVAQGTHTSTNVVATVTTGVKYQIIAKP